MLVTITDRCQGHGRCLALVPEAFDVNDDGYGEVRGSGEFPDDWNERLQKAVLNCPESAISVHP
jgi:ferredoxin